MKTSSRILLYCLLILAFSSCKNEKKTEIIVEKADSTTFDLPPNWAKEVVWYQIFVERFRNGDSSNDPTKDDIVGTYPNFIPENWHITPWTQDWYAEDDYFAELKGKTDANDYPVTKFGQKSQLQKIRWRFAGRFG